MVTFNWPAILGSAAIPLFFGALWYSNQVFELITGEKSGNRKHPPLVFIMCYVLGIPMAMMLTAIMSTHEVVDQHAMHGFFHGVMAGTFLILPAFTIHFMFEGDRTVRNMIFHILYWLISLGLIGLIVFAWK